MPNTTNLALPYPALTDAPNVPTHMQSLANAVDTRLGGNWTAFTLTAAGSLNVGTFGTGATQDNAYKLIGNRTALIRIFLTLGTSPSITGTLGLGPFTGLNMYPANGLSGLLFRGGTTIYPLFCTPSGGQITRLYYQGGTVGATTPITWAANDIIRIAGTVELG